MIAVAPAPYQMGQRLFGGEELNKLFGYPVYSAEDNIVASATQTQAAAYQLTAQMSRVVTVASSGNGVGLPPAQVGKSIVIDNSHASNGITVFAAVGTSDTINGTAGATGITQAAASRHWYNCYTAGAWIEY